ncbi:hypothetical protein [Histidinibacterium lentulum]|uniref:Uncharacterized protein n=1 Tax=Histidinibacterium lentulum TaxID=2480588 RepID=A0A3N2QW57_9RHOB|nr:hypothetical protein [Histidinibacterium lentulum]ROT99369.1 hypothetical protein EAT49_14210 [Histidinibacterium lentulum]
MIVLMLGSAPNVMASRDWPRAPFDRIVAINNAWRVRPDWDDLVFPEDFPVANRPRSLATGQRLVEADAFVPAQNAWGGFVYAGGTMAFTAGYWALEVLKPRVIAYLGCDMVYGGGSTHFYGRGTADPLRADITLRSLEAKATRFMVRAAEAGTAVVNLSTSPSRLVFPRATPATVAKARPQVFDPASVDAALSRERALGYMVPSGRYWEEADRFDAHEIDRLDALWFDAGGITAPAAAEDLRVAS